MVRGTPSKPVYLVAMLAMAVGFASRNPARAMDPQDWADDWRRRSPPPFPPGAFRPTRNW